jgi:hypothetical protein
VCYYCHRQLGEGYGVMWAGAGPEQLALHPECAVELTLRLLRDVHQIECMCQRKVTARPL